MAAQAALHWYSASGEAFPPCLAPIELTPIRDLAQISQYSICFVPADGKLPGLEVLELRSRLASLVYVIAVSVQDISVERHSSLFEAGADDVLSGPQATHVLPSLLRARRQLRNWYVYEAERKKLERNLQVWQDCLDHLPTPIFFKNLDGRYFGCNNAFADFFGSTRDEVIGRRLDDFLPPDAMPPHRASDTMLIRDGGSFEIETDMRRGDADTRHVLLHKARVTTRDNNIEGLAGVLIDITDRKNMERRLTSAAERDALTNAYNRRKFFQLAAEATKQAMETGEALAVAVIDIDHFKWINDEYGHAQGDKTLCAAVDILRLHESDDVVIARAGGEEFFALFKSRSLDQLAQMLETIRTKIGTACRLETANGIAGTVSIGVSIFRSTSETIDQALRRADMALYRAKKSGRDRICLDEAA